MTHLYVLCKKSSRISRWLSGKEAPCQSMQELKDTQVRSLGQEDPLEEEMTTSLVYLLGKSYGQRKLAGCSPGGWKESDTAEQLCTKMHK